MARIDELEEGRLGGERGRTERRQLQRLGRPGLPAVGGPSEGVGGTVRVETTAHARLPSRKWATLTCAWTLPAWTLPTCGVMSRQAPPPSSVRYSRAAALDQPSASERRWKASRSSRTPREAPRRLGGEVALALGRSSRAGWRGSARESRRETRRSAIAAMARQRPSQRRWPTCRAREVGKPAICRAKRLPHFNRHPSALVQAAVNTYYRSPRHDQAEWRPGG